MTTPPSLFDANANISLKGLYQDAWARQDANKHTSMRYCDLYWLALAMRADHDAYFAQYGNELVPEEIINNMLPIWAHATKPILQMSLRETMDTLFGIEWYALCDWFVVPNIPTLKRTVDLVRHRLYFLSTRASASSFILDMSGEGYVEEETPNDATMKQNLIRLQDDEYFSDEDTRRRRRAKREAKQQSWVSRLGQVTAALLTQNKEEEGQQQLEEGTVAPSQLKATERKCTWALAHDANCTLREIDLAIMEYEQESANITWHGSKEVRVASFRRHLHILFCDYEQLIPKRKLWQHQALCLSSHRAIHHRKTGRAFASPSEILSAKLKNMININLPVSIDDMLADHATVPSAAWKRVNTDFLFWLASSVSIDKGDVWEFLTSQRIIRQQRLARKWIVEDAHGFDSFTHAFIFLRKRQRAQNIPHVVYLEPPNHASRLPEDIDLSQFDEHFKGPLDQENQTTPRSSLT